MGLGRRRTALAATLLVGALAAAGCATEPVPSPPSGVDGLTVPTPSADPRDFVRGITNPWLALEPGTRREYQSGGNTRTLTVTDETVDVQGVAATVVHTEQTDLAGKPTASYDNLLAQDRDGNVWVLGRRVAKGDLEPWQAGVNGAEAGLLMAAHPRRGDGYALADAPGANADRALVLTLEAQVDVPAGSFDDVLQVSVTSALEPGGVAVRSYARGVGLVEDDDVDAVWVLVRTTDG